MPHSSSGKFSESGIRVGAESIPTNGDEHSVVHRTATTRASAGTAVSARTTFGGLASASRPAFRVAGVLRCNGGDAPTKRANQCLHTRLAQLAFHLCPIPKDRTIPTREAYHLFFFPLDEVVRRYTLAASITDTRQWHGFFDRPCSKSQHSCVLIMMMAPNAALHLPLEAGARYERRLEAVRCKRSVRCGAGTTPRLWAILPSPGPPPHQHRATTSPTPCRRGGDCVCCSLPCPYRSSHSTAAAMPYSSRALGA